jgi:methionyl-tRNA formyltransferase
MKKLNVVFCGTPDFSVPTLEALTNHPILNMVGVITMPDRPAGRGQKMKSPPVAEFAQHSKIKLFQTENINKEPEFIQELENLNIDVIIVLAFAQFLGSKVLNLPKLGCFNIHTSLLPKYRGAAPIQYALLNGDTSTGVSIQKMVKQMDAGDIVHSHPVEISDNETGGQLYTRLKFQAALSADEFINNLINNKINYLPQNHEEATFAPVLKKTDGLIDFNTKSFTEIKNQIRALHPWPGTYCYLNKKRLKVFEIEKAMTKIDTGSTQTEHGNLVVGTIDGAIRLTYVQLEGKKACTDSELLNGLKNNKEELIINP